MRPGRFEAKRKTKRNLKLTVWQIEALERLCNQEVARHADDEKTPWLSGVQSLAEILNRSDAVTCTENPK